MRCTQYGFAADSERRNQAISTTRGVLAMVAAIAVWTCGNGRTDGAPQAWGARLERLASGAVAGTCNDGDGDGFGDPGDATCPEGAAEDCDDGDPSVNPDATEICGDGIDNDCDDDVDGADADIVLVPNLAIPVFGFESRGVCQEDTNIACDLRFALPPNCSCIGNVHNFAQVVQACVDGGSVTGPCDNGDPNAPGSLAIGDACVNGGTCVPVPVALGEPCVEGNGVCRQLGTVVCDGGNVICDAVPGAAVTEGGGSPDERAHDATCFDELDNDCDGVVDHEDPECRTAERCDGFDNDFVNGIDDGFPLGDECTVGPAGTPCENTGIYICGADGALACSVNANPPEQLVETACGDAKDNDCDGDVDCDDSNCTSPDELCDGVDNNCNQQIDEGFAALGDLCIVGQGACQAVGALVCNADKNGVVCSAFPGASSPERRTAGNSCSDGIDNDCDGVLEADEPECQAAGLTVQCSLVYDGPPADRRMGEGKNGRGETGSDCEGWHFPNWTTSGAVGDVTCTGALLALNSDESVLAALPVQIGERSHLVSRVDPSAWKFVSKTTGSGKTTHEIFAPIPLLEVTCRDDATTAKAYCANMPWLEVIKPDGGVVSGSVGDEIQVVAGIPRVEPRTLKVLIDCVDIIPLLVADPATQLPGGPFSGPVNINGNVMQVQDLFVRSPKPITRESTIEHLSANTVTFTLIGSGCGGHAIVVDGVPAWDVIPAQTGNLSSACYLDEARDLAQWSVFTLDITSPTPAQVIDDGGQRPTSINVQGDVCHGRDIEEVLINGFVATLPAPTVVDGGPDECAGDSKTVTMHIDEDVPVTDVAAVFAGTQSTLGSFDPGPNKLVGQATDTGGNTTHDLVPFVVGPAIPAPGAAAAAFASAASQAVADRLGAIAADPSKIPKAFTVILDDSVTLPNGNSALREFFTTVSDEFALNLANCLLQPKEICCSKELEMPWWTCNPNVTFCTSPEIVLTPEEFADTFDISVIPQDGLVTIRFRIPQFNMLASAHGNCCTGGCGFFCVARTRVDFDGVIRIPDITLEIDISEDNILQQDGTFTLRFIPGDDDNIDIDGNLEDAIKTGCGLLSIGTLIDVLTLGLSALPRVIFNGLTTILGFLVDAKGIDLCPFTKEIAGKDGMQEKSDDQTLCKEDLGTDFDTGLEHTIDQVEITPQGIALIVGVTVAPTTIDPEADPIPATLMTEAPPCLPGTTGTENFRSVSVAIADDFWNQLLAGMYQSGKFKSSFTKVFDLGKYFPECDTITGGPIADRRRARCIGTTECNDPSDFDVQDRCQACLDEFPFRTCGGTTGAPTCTFDNDCPGTCQGVCQGGLQDGQPCTPPGGCGLVGNCINTTCIGGPTPGAACNQQGDCRDDCIGCLADDDDTCVRGVCIRAARRARDRKINANTDIVLHARLDSPPAFYLVDDPATPDKVDIIFRSGEMRAALIANRDGNNDVNGLSLGDGSCDDNEPCVPNQPCDDGELDKLDLTTVADCGLDSLPSNVDCLLWSTCIDLNVQFAIGVHNELVDGHNRPQLDFELVGIVEPPPGIVVEDQGEQCGGPEEIADLDFMNTESTRNDARKGMERKFCQSTPPFQSCGNDFNGVVEFLNPSLLTVSNCTNAAVCDLDFADYLVITGDLSSQGLGTLIADKVCAKLTQKVTESKGECSSNDDGGDEEREKICP